MHTAEQQYRENEIAELAGRIVKLLDGELVDPMIKAAALRSAAEIMQQAVTTQALLVSLHQTLNRPR